MDAFSLAELSGIKATAQLRKYASAHVSKPAYLQANLTLKRLYSQSVTACEVNKYLDVPHGRSSYAFEAVAGSPLAAFGFGCSCCVMEDYDYTGTGAQFPSDDILSWPVDEALLPEDFDVDLYLSTGLVLPSNHVDENLYDGFLNTPLLPPIGNHTQPLDDFDFAAELGSWDGFVDYEQALSSLGSQNRHGELHTSSRVSSHYIVVA